MQFSANMHGELKLPAHGLHDARGRNFGTNGIMENHFYVGSFLEGSNLQIYPQPAAIRISLCGKRTDLCLFGNSPGEIVFGKEKFHPDIITTKDPGRIWRCDQVNKSAQTIQVCALYFLFVIPEFNRSSFGIPS